MAQVPWLAALAVFLIACFLSQPVAAQPLHEGGPEEPAEARQVAAWEPGAFIESIAFASDGSVYVANHLAGSIDRVVDGKIARFARMPGLPTGILLRPEGGLLVTGRAEGGPETLYAVSNTGDVSVLVTIPQAGFLNGMTWLEAGTVLIADSNGGVIWSIETGTGQVSQWARDPLLGHSDPTAHFPSTTAYPAANGIKRFGDAIYVSNSARALILRLDLFPGGRAGPAHIYAESLVADDFAFDEHGNLFAPTHPMQSVVRLGRDGSRRTIATPAQGLTGPTAVALAADGSLYVVGNSTLPINGKQRPSALVRLDAAKPFATQVRQIIAPIYMMVVAPTIAGSDHRRAEHGDAYLRFLEDNFEKIAIGGQIMDPGNEVVERVYLVEAEAPDEARALMEASPYFQNQIYGPLEVKPLQAMLGVLLGGTAWPVAPQGSSGR